MSLKSLISRKRKELGMSLEEIGKAAGVHRSTVYRWANGSIRTMKMSKVETLSKVLQIDPMELLRALIN